MYIVDDSYKDVLNVSLKEGRWFVQEDIAGREDHILINETLKEKLFGNETAIGKLIGYGIRKWQV